MVSANDPGRAAAGLPTSAPDSSPRGRRSSRQRYRAFLTYFRQRRPGEGEAAPALIERGTHESLMRAHGVYYDMVPRQIAVAERRSVPVFN